MNRRIEKGERRALPPRPECGACGKVSPPLDVAGGERTQRPGNLGGGEIGEVPLFERGDPCVEPFVRAARFHVFL
jgi:hypothetical protein